MALPNFKDLVTEAIDRRKGTQQQNLAVRDAIAAALQAAHEAHSPWKAMPPDEEIVGNVTKRLNISCEDAFRLHLIIFDGGQVLFPKIEASAPFCASNCAEALHEIARRFALHRMLDEAAAARRSVQAR